mgnify:CR=1 FL=1
MIENRHVKTLDDRLRGIEAAVEKHRAQHGFQRVCKDRRAAEAAAAQFAFTKAQAFGNIKGLSNLVERLLLDQIGADARQIAFVQFAETLEQKRSHRAIQDGVAEKLEPFVMRGTMTAVR